MQIRSLAAAGTAGALALTVFACGASAAPRTSRPASAVTVTMSRRGPAIAGPRTWRPGAARIAVTSRVADQELVLLHFRPGYDYARFLADGERANGRGAAARPALARLFANTVFDGGVDLWPGQTASFTVAVRPGTYYLGEMTARPQLTAIHVAGAPSVAPRAGGAVVTATDTGYRVDGTLPRAGTITVRNLGSRHHRLNLFRVKPGTTRAELGAYLRKTGASENAPPPAFALDGPQLGIADLSAHGELQLTYRLPAGEYALVDLDRDMTNGRPQALDGMYAIATLH